MLRGVGRSLEGKQAVVAVVEGDSEALVEGEALAPHLGVEALDLDGSMDEPQRAPRRVEGAVAEELLELQNVPVGDRRELLLKQQHLPVGGELALEPAPRDVPERLGEGAEVVHEPETVDHRIDDAWTAEVDRARGARVDDAGPAVECDRVAVWQLRHPGDSTP